MTTTLNVIDLQLKDAVTRQLESNPEVDASLVGVSAQDGIVTLTGAGVEPA